MPISILQYDVFLCADILHGDLYFIVGNCLDL